MGVLDNPRVIGNWAVKGTGGAVAILIKLAQDGYEFSEEEKGIIKERAIAMLGVVGFDLTETISDLQAEVDRGQAELSAYRSGHGGSI